MQPTGHDDAALECRPSANFAAWLADQKLSLAFTTYQAGKLFLIGLQPDGRLSIFERTFNRCMGLWSDGQTMWMSTLYQLWRFENALPVGETSEGFDRLYIPQLAYTTGNLDVHDVAVDPSGKPIFVNTLFSCIAAPSETKSFRPIWRPHFVNALAPEDRCHLNGLACDAGQPVYATAIAETNVADGWRNHREDGGVLIDVAGNATVLRGLSMPHSPRLHRGALWLLESGRGFFGRVDLQAGRFDPLVFCPGYLRGLTFHGDFAIVGLSQPRSDTAFAGLPIDATLGQQHVEPQCGLMVIDLKTGTIVHWLKISGLVHELYDVVCLPSVVRPKAVGFKTDEITRIVSIES